MAAWDNRTIAGSEKFSRSEFASARPSSLRRLTGCESDKSQNFRDGRERQDEVLFVPLHLLSILIRRRLLIVTLLLSALLVGILATWMQPSKYRAVAKLEVATPATRVLKDIELMPGGADQRVQKTTIEHFKSRALHERVVNELQLSTRRKFGEPEKVFDLSTLLSQFLRSSGQTRRVAVSAEQRRARAINVVSAGIGLSPVRGTNIIAVSFSGSDRVLSAAIANQLVASYVEQQVDRNAETSASARTFISTQVAGVKKNKCRRRKI